MTDPPNKIITYAEDSTMRILGPLILLLMLDTTAHAQSFTGSYTGILSGTATTLTLDQEGSSFSGQADASGYLYTLSGTVQETIARGTLTDPQTGGTLNVELALQGDELTLTLLSQDPYSGQVNRIPATFQRSSPTNAPPTAPQAQSPEAPQGERDPALVGAWTFTETMMSGEFSAVTQLSLQIHPDGTYLYGNGRTTAGGSNAYGSISGDTGSDGDVTRGQWRTQGSIVYIKESSEGPWTPYARYYVEGGRLMFTFGDGSRQVWHRQ